MKSVFPLYTFRILTLYSILAWAPHAHAQSAATSESKAAMPVVSSEITLPNISSQADESEKIISGWASWPGIGVIIDLVMNYHSYCNEFECRLYKVDTCDDWAVTHCLWLYKNFPPRTGTDVNAWYEQCKVDQASHCKTVGKIYCAGLSYPGVKCPYQIR